MASLVASHVCGSRSGCAGFLVSQERAAVEYRPAIDGPGGEGFGSAFDWECSGQNCSQEAGIESHRVECQGVSLVFGELMGTVPGPDDVGSGAATDD